LDKISFCYTKKQATKHRKRKVNTLNRKNKRQMKTDNESKETINDSLSYHSLNSTLRCFLKDITSIRVARRPFIKLTKIAYMVVGLIRTIYLVTVSLLMAFGHAYVKRTIANHRILFNERRKIMPITLYGVLNKYITTDAKILTFEIYRRNQQINITRSKLPTQKMFIVQGKLSPKLLMYHATSPFNEAAALVSRSFAPTYPVSKNTVTQLNDFFYNVYAPEFQAGMLNHFQQNGLPEYSIKAYLDHLISSKRKEYEQVKITNNPIPHSVESLQKKEKLFVKNEELKAPRIVTVPKLENRVRANPFYYSFEQMLKNVCEGYEVPSSLSDLNKTITDDLKYNRDYYTMGGDVEKFDASVRQPLILLTSWLEVLYFEAMLSMEDPDLYRLITITNTSLVSFRCILLKALLDGVVPSGYGNTKSRNSLINDIVAKFVAHMAGLTYNIVKTKDGNMRDVYFKACGDDNRLHILLQCLERFREAATHVYSGYWADEGIGLHLRVLQLTDSSFFDYLSLTFIRCDDGHYIAIKPLARFFQFLAWTDKNKTEEELYQMSYCEGHNIRVNYGHLPIFRVVYKRLLQIGTAVNQDKFNELMPWQSTTVLLTDKTQPENNLEHAAFYSYLLRRHNVSFKEVQDFEQVLTQLKPSDIYSTEIMDKFQLDLNNGQTISRDSWIQIPDDKPEENIIRQIDGYMYSEALRIKLASIPQYDLSDLVPRNKQV